MQSLLHPKFKNSFKHVKAVAELCNAQVEGRTPAIAGKMVKLVKDTIESRIKSVMVEVAPPVTHDVMEDVMISSPPMQMYSEELVTMFGADEESGGDEATEEIQSTRAD